MKYLYSILIVCLCTLTSQAGYTLQWEKDLTNYSTTTNLSEAVFTGFYADGSIAVSLCDKEATMGVFHPNPTNPPIFTYVFTNTVVAFNSNGTLKLHDSFETTIKEVYRDYCLPHFIIGSTRNFNSIMTYPHWSSESKELRIYEITDTTNIITTITTGYSGDSLDDSTSGDPAVFATIEEGKMLRVYRFDNVPAVIDASVASGIDGSNYIMSWDSSLGTDYQIQSSDNLTNNWVDVGAAIAGTGDTLTWANALTNSQSFYRVVEQ